MAFFNRTPRHDCWPCCATTNTSTLALCGLARATIIFLCLFAENVGMRPHRSPIVCVYVCGGAQKHLINNCQRYSLVRDTLRSSYSHIHIFVQVQQKNRKIANRIDAVVAAVNLSLFFWRPINATINKLKSASVHHRQRLQL